MTISREWAGEFLENETGAEWMDRKAKDRAEAKLRASNRAGQIRYRQGLTEDRQQSEAKRRTTPMPRKADEADLQADLMKYLEVDILRDAIAFSVPNEASRGRGRVQSMGLYAGMADLVFLSRGGISYVMELKVKAKLSPSQEDFRDICRELEIPWALCRSLDDAVEQLRLWRLLRRRPC